MTPASPRAGPSTGGPTIRSILARDRAELATTIGAAVAQAAARGDFGAGVQPLPRPAIGLAARATADAAIDLAEVDLGSILIAAWRAQRQVVAAARRTATPPPTEASVTLGRQEVSGAFRPTIELLVDDRPAATIHITIGIVLRVETPVVTLRGGRLVAIGIGGTEAVASLAIEGREIARQTRRRAARLDLDFGSGVAIAGAPGP